MTQAEEIAELRRWMREDIKGLHTKLEERDHAIHTKIDDLRNSNATSHECLQKQLTAMDKKTEVNNAVLATKIATFVVILGFIVTGFATAGWQKVLGIGG